ncbi:DUF4145 domain-containing protein [Acinetobacter sp. TGL-Y2]|uniref:DUF4145 domain-containing protein n=1 Tax=Acinetobacter sp. TGL-Y2 TaxID=1407071 RepID=UPI000AE97116|nr:DUF4145 domain-containing protein [Acinetobacter sp. TGL-Y2]
MMKLNTLNPIFQDSVSKNKIVYKKVLCIECKTHIKHEVLVDISEYDQTHSPIEFYLNYRILKCINCETITYQTKNLCSEDVYQVGYELNGDPIYHEDATYKVFPIRDEETAFSIEFEKILPIEIYNTYEEVVVALNNKMPLLTVLGLRTLLEQIIKHFGKSDDLGVILNQFEQDGFISTKQRALLDDIRYLGNDAAHRADSKSRKNLILHLKVLENLIHQLFVYYKMGEESSKKQLRVSD